LNSSFELSPHPEKVKALWEHLCNFLRPSRPLGGKTPWEYLMENHRGVVSFDAKLSQMIP